ncbi:MAG: hypothetical protein NPIRA02_23400 [Nitrospirales bacterium]|nr:MAG: hypothetical protein NPIRA02_23400 [Nitrospirales bacterium]
MKKCAQHLNGYMIIVILLGGMVTSLPESHASIVIHPGNNIQTFVNAHPEGTTFLLQPGVYRGQQIVPKSGNSFIGESGVILSGAALLRDFSPKGNRWSTPYRWSFGQPHGLCKIQANGQRQTACQFPENLFIDGKILTQVTRLSEVRLGTWFLDRTHKKIYIANNPRNQKVEISVIPHAFSGKAANVTIKNLIIEKYANPAQQGAIHGKASANGHVSDGWHIQGVEVRFNHGTGIRVGHRMKLIANHIHHNGQLGIGGSGDDIVAENNVIALNNTQGFSTGWEAGGVKFVKTKNVVIRGNVIQQNVGPGLWIDDDNINTLYEGNRILDNTHAGIIHMTSYAAMIRNNWVKGNGYGFSKWLWGSGILVHSSPNVEIYGNTLIHNADGISAIEQKAGTGKYGPYEVRNLFVHHNHIAMNTGQSGVVQDTGNTSLFGSRNNRFQNNTYVIPDDAKFFRWSDRRMTPSEWRTFGHDVNGRFFIRQSRTIDEELAVPIRPGQNIQAKVDQHPEGTIFLIKSGLHRFQQIVPKNGNTFLGENGAILSGAKRLATFTREGPYWVAHNQTQQGDVESLQTACMVLESGAQAHGCRYPEDLFLDNTPLLQVTRLDRVKPGKWFFDYKNDKIYLIDNPVGHKVETSVTPHAFFGNANNVTIKNLIIEKYANPARQGAIHARKAFHDPQGQNWRIENSEIRLNHGWGIRAGDAMEVFNCYVHHNAQLGIGGTGKNIKLQGNEIAFNNTQDFSWDFEAGGIKFLKTRNLQVIGNLAHHNVGCGLWTDIDNRSTLYAGNHVFDNARCGIYHEVGFSALIQHNLTERNGFGYPLWLWGSGIVVYSSPNVEVRYNLVSNNMGGIAGIQQNRLNSQGSALLRNLHVHHNFISLSKGTGLVYDRPHNNAVFTSQNNRFENNNYILGDSKKPFRWLRALHAEDEWQAFGNDVKGTFSRIEAGHSP